MIHIFCIHPYNDKQEDPLFTRLDEDHFFVGGKDSRCIMM